MFPPNYFCQVPLFSEILLHLPLIAENIIKCSPQFPFNGGRECRLPIVHQFIYEEKRWVYYIKAVYEKRRVLITKFKASALHSPLSFAAPAKPYPTVSWKKRLIFSYIWNGETRLRQKNNPKSLTRKGNNNEISVVQKLDKSLSSE